MKTLWKNKKINCIIYLISVAISIVCIVIYFCVSCNEDEKMSTFLISTGASLLASVILGFSLELSKEIKFEEKKKETRKERLTFIKERINSLGYSFAKSVFVCKHILKCGEKPLVGDEERTFAEWIAEWNDLYKELQLLSKSGETNEKLEKIHIELKDTLLLEFDETKTQIEKDFETLTFFERAGFFTTFELTILEFACLDLKTVISDLQNSDSFDDLIERRTTGHLEIIFEAFAVIPELNILEDRTTISTEEELPF